MLVLLIVCIFCKYLYSMMIDCKHVCLRVLLCTVLIFTINILRNILVYVLLRGIAFRFKMVLICPRSIVSVNSYSISYIASSMPLTCFRVIALQSFLI